MKLVFVYNADSGVFNTLSDIAHKLISPQTYQCNLCTLTHGVFSEREEWIEFLQQLDTEIEFLHRDEYIRQYADQQVELPAIFINREGQLKLWLDKKVINNMQSTDELMALIRRALSERKAAMDELSNPAANTAVGE